MIDNTYAAASGARDGVLAAAPTAPRARGQAGARARERARRRVVTLVGIVYLLLIFEGSIRKWLLPELSAYIFFIRDPFVIYVYFLAFHHHLWPRRQLPLLVVTVIAAVGVLIGLATIASSTAGAASATVAAYGWRNYFLYAPLAFLVGAQFDADDIRRFCRWTLLLAAPIGVLVALQFASPPGAAINVGSSADAALQFTGIGLDADHTRPMGTFSSVAAQTQFVASAFAMLLALAIMPSRQRRLPAWLLIAAAAGIATCVALGGNRSALLSCVVVAAVATALVAIGRSATVKRRALALPFVMAAGFAVLFPVVFPEGFETFSRRWETAAAAEQQVGGIVGRTLYGFFDFARLLADAPVLGYGLGMGGNAALTLGVAGGDTAVPYAESDWARHVVDLGPGIGLCYIGLRIVLTAWLGIVVLRATRRGAGPLPLCLFAYVALVLLNGQITGQGAINGYAWLFTGLTLAAAAQTPQANASSAAPRTGGPASRSALTRAGARAQRRLRHRATTRTATSREEEP